MATRTKAPTSPTGIFVARSAGVFRIKGQLHRYHVGQTFPEGHPLLKVNPGAFEPVTFDDAPARATIVEKASA
jgi:hypothetical protein